MAIFGLAASELLVGGAATTSVGKAAGRQKGSPAGQEKKLAKGLSIPAASMIGSCCFSGFGCMMVLGMVSQMKQTTSSAMGGPPGY